MTIEIKRIYDDIAPTDGARILVDRLWPRGMSKEKAQISLWPKELTPSTELRRWYHQDDEMELRWPEFQQRYAQELDAQQESLHQLQALAQHRDLTLLTAAKNMQNNHAHILKAVLLKAHKSKRKESALKE